MKQRTSYGRGRFSQKNYDQNDVQIMPDHPEYFKLFAKLGEAKNFVTFF